MNDASDIDFQWEFCTHCGVDHLASDTPVSCTVEDLQKKVKSLKAIIDHKDEEVAGLRKEIKNTSKEFSKIIENLKYEIEWGSIRKGDAE